MISERKKPQRVHLPMLNKVLSNNDFSERGILPEKYMQPKHMLVKNQKRRDFISQTLLKPYKASDEDKSNKMVNLGKPLDELEQLSRFFQKKYQKDSRKKDKDLKTELVEAKYKQLIDLARSRLQKYTASTTRNTNPETQREILEEFNADLHVRRWGQLGLAIKKQEQRGLASLGSKRSFKRFQTEY